MERKFRRVNLSRALNDTERQQFLLFTKFFDELWSNWEELRTNGLELSGTFERMPDGKVSGGNLGVSRHRIKGFLVDYRHFSGADEPTNFFKIVKLIRSACRDSDLHRLLDHYKDRWAKASGLSGWHNNFSADDVINAIFNESIFHAVPTARNSVRLSEIEMKLTDDAMWWELTYVIFMRMSLILQVKIVISAVAAGANALAVPEDLSAHLRG